MDFSEDWKSHWPIGSVFSPPLFLHLDEAEQPSSPSKRYHLEDDEDGAGGGGITHEELGPLIFIPCCKTLVELYSSPDLAPRLPPPYPGLSLARFLHTTGSFILPSTASSIAFEFGPQVSQTDTNVGNCDSSSMHNFNCLQVLPCCEKSNSVLVFFPSGENGDQVGYVVLRFEDSLLSIKINEVNNKVFTAKEKLNHRILKLLVNPIVDIDDNLLGGVPSYFAVIGYLMACSLHSVHWYVVKTIGEHEKFQVKSALLDFVGSKSFRSSGVVHACWSPHLSEESVVLLETGEIYLFDLSCCLKKTLSSNNRVWRKKLQVLWDVNKHHDNSGVGCWLSCEFSWHPRILVVAHTTAIFLVDARSESCTASCLLKIEMLSTVQNDRFLALSLAVSDGFNFCVATKRSLLLCDVRQPWRPMLQWIHNLDNPHYITVFRLSELRSSAKDEKYKWASESGFCILLGSFWNCEFSLFIYGPNNNRRHVFSEISKFCDSFYAWGLPSELSLSGRDCHCGSCLLRDEFLKDSLPNWIDWRQKKDVVLGFAILCLDRFAQLPKPDNFGGFSLIRLMSSGKLEVQSYCAAWEVRRISSEAYFRSLSNSDDNLLYETYDFDYDLKKKFQFLKLDYFEGYLKGHLAEILVEKVKQLHKIDPEKEAKDESSQTLETDGSNGSILLSRSFDAFEDIKFPVSIHEIALRVIWSRLQLAFSSQSEFPRVAESSSISHHMVQFPFQRPSCYSSKLLPKTQPSNDLLDSFLPPQFLLTLHKLSNKKLRTKLDILSADSEIDLQCDRILEVGDELNDCHGTSLSDDTEKLSDGGENLQNFSLYKPEALCEEVSAEDMAPTKSGTENKRFTNFIFRKHQDKVCNVDTEMAGMELLDTRCPLELEFNNNSVTFGQEELKQFTLLKKQDLNFQKGFILYQEFITKGNLVNQGI